MKNLIKMGGTGPTLIQTGGGQPVGLIKMFGGTIIKMDGGMDLMGGSDHI